MPGEDRFPALERAKYSFSQFLFSAQGRISRSRFWISLVLLGLGIIVPTIIFAATALPRNVNIWVVYYVITIFVWLVQWPIIVILIKRIHDRNKSGWTVLIYYVPATLDAIVNFTGGQESLVETTLSLISLVIGIWFFVEFGCMRGTIGHNRFGPDPVV
jgi:uncharacterized membrane protein YhaH (DUF805 family)